MSSSGPKPSQTQQIYRDHATTYDRVRRKDGVEHPWLDRFLAPLAAPASILDLGCGSGDPFAVQLLEQGYSLTGLDFSPELLAIAQDRYPDAQFIQQDLRALDMGPARFCGVICWGVIFHLMQDDQRSLIPKIGRLLKPGGRFLMTIGDRAGEGQGYIDQVPVYHASLSLDGYRKAIEDAGLEILNLTVRDEMSGGATVVLAEKKVRMD